MSFAAIVAAIFLALALLPQPLMLLDTLFVRLLARSITKASDGSVDTETASRRIRRIEQLTPEESARLFAAIVFIGSSLIAAIATRSNVRIFVVAFLSVFTGWLAAKSSDRFTGKVVAVATGAACLFVIS